MTPNEQEALSIRYAKAAIVTPLEDGRFAVFANDRTAESLVIVDEGGLAIAVKNRANRPGVSRAIKQQQTREQREVVIADGSSPSDYGM